MSSFFEGPSQIIFLQPHKQGQRKNKIARVSLHSTFNFTLHNRSRLCLSHTGPSESFDSALICTCSCLCITSILYHLNFVSPQFCITSILYHLNFVSPQFCITSIN